MEEPMEKTVVRINGWEVRQREDGSYGVYDEHGFMNGPFGWMEDAVVAAKSLPTISVKPPAPSVNGRSGVRN
jgi:hypothetical protein